MWKKAVLNFALKSLNKYLVSKISYDLLRVYVEGAVMRLEKLVEIITDKNPDDKTQLKELWDNEKENLFDNTLETAAEIVLDKVEDQELAAFVAALILDLRKEQDDNPAKITPVSIA